MTLILGHRGASAAAPENTLEAFRLALTLGADGVELDVRPSPGMPVQHDFSATPLPGAPSLPAVLDACAGSLVNVELKNLQGEPDFDPAEGLSDAVVALLASRGGADDVIVSSFNLSAVNRVKEVGGADVRTGFLVMVAPGADVVGRVIDRARRHGHDAIHPHHVAVDETFMSLARAAGLAVHTWTVDDPGRMEQLAALGVDSIITNVPDVAIATLRG